VSVRLQKGRLNHSRGLVIPTLTHLQDHPCRLPSRTLKVSPVGLYLVLESVFEVIFNFRRRTLRAGYGLMNFS